MKKNVLLCCFLGLCQLAFGQNKGDLILKYSPSGLLDYYGRYIQFAGEYILEDGNAVEVEGGFVVAESAWRQSPEMVFDQGIKIRAGWRKYLDDERFAGILISARNEKFDIEGDFDRFGSSFFQRLSYQVDQQQYGILAQLGFQIKLGKRFTLEYSGGAGVRSIFRTYGGVPEDAVFITNNSSFARFSRKREEIVQLSVFLSLKFGFMLVKN